MRDNWSLKAAFCAGVWCSLDWVVGAQTSLLGFAATMLIAGVIFRLTGWDRDEHHPANEKERRA